MSKLAVIDREAAHAQLVWLQEEIAVLGRRLDAMGLEAIVLTNVLSARCISTWWPVENNSWLLSRYQLATNSIKSGKCLSAILCGERETRLILMCMSTARPISG
jgi:hypothetical protein